MNFGEVNDIGKSIFRNIAYNMKDGAIFEFGVNYGNTLTCLLDNMILLNKKPTGIFGFDNFMGLPKEQEGIHKDNDWFETAFNVVDELKRININTTREEAIELVKGRFKEYEKYDFFVKLIIGWYSELNKQTIIDYNMIPASFIHVDCDLYISAKQALEFMFGNNLVLNGCLIRYDDWKLDPTYGEHLAHIETVKKYNLKDTQINENTFIIEL